MVRHCQLKLLTILLPLLLLGATPAVAKCTDPPGPKVDWSKCDREKKRLRNMDLRGAIFERTDLTFSDLSGSNLTGARLTRATLNSAFFKGADLSGADLSKAEFERAVFRDARLEQVRLAFADLARADLTGARLAGADLAGAYTLLTRIEGTDLSGVTGLSQQQLDITCGDAETLLPEGLTAPAAWPCEPEDAD